MKDKNINFKGIWIPLELIHEDLTWTQRILLAEVSQLEMLDKGCVASNTHFAEKLLLTPQAISKALNELAKNGYIIIDNAQTKRNFGRKITINHSKSAINCRKSPINSGKSAINHSGESKENNTINNTKNNTINNTSENKSRRAKRPDQLLIEYFFQLKGWDNKPQKELNIVFPRYLKTAKQILEIATLEEAKEKVRKISVWAKNNELDWSLETTIKKWLEIDNIKLEKEKKSYIDGNTAYKRSGKWFLIENGEHLEYVGEESKIEWR